jgi:hypothetical protein
MLFMRNERRQIVRRSGIAVTSIYSRLIIDDTHPVDQNQR